MSVPPTALLLSISIGLPILLLALGVFYHARVIARPATIIDTLGAQVETMAVTDHTEELLAELQNSMHAIRQQLSQQRQSLSGMLSNDAPRPRGIPAMEASLRATAPAATATTVAGRMIEAQQNIDPGTELRVSVTRLVSEGLSDRAIARQLRIGLEEVRMARTRTGTAS
jgi:DNA-binding NarL/FixJ family response regulator